MNLLPTQFTRDHDTLTLLKRSGKAAIYKRTGLDDKITHFEVFAIKSKDGSEIYPPAHAFGVWAWSPLVETRAETYFNRIETGETVIPDVDPVTGNVNIGPDVVIDELPDVNPDPSLPAPAPIVPPLVAEIPISTIPAGWNKIEDDNETVAPVSTDENSVEAIDPIAPVPVVQPTIDGSAVVEVASVRRGRVASAISFPAGEFTKVDFAKYNSMQEGNAYVRLMKEIEAGRAKVVRHEKLTAGRGRPTAIYSAV